MKKQREYRYVQKRVETETSYNIHVKEMISVLKNDKIKENIYVKKVKLSNHAFLRFYERINKDMNLSQATRYVRSELSKAVRVGTIVSYDGRVNVLYIRDSVGYHMSPDLKTVVTIGLYNELNVELVKELKREYGISKSYLDECELLDIHKRKLKCLELDEKTQCESLLKLEEETSKTKDICRGLILQAGTERKRRGYKKLISEHSYALKIEGRKLFRTSIKKRLVLRSMASLIKGE